MTAIVHNIVVEQGATFRLPVAWKNENQTPVDITGYSAAMQIRQKPDSAQALVSLTHTLTAAGQIVLGGAQGTIEIVIKHTATSQIPPGDWVYDLELTNPSGDVTRLIMGSAKVTPEVTKS